MTHIVAVEPQQTDPLSLLREATVQGLALYRIAGFPTTPPFGPCIGDPVSRCIAKELAS